MTPSITTLGISIECHFAECRIYYQPLFYAECHCRYVVYHYAERRGTISPLAKKYPMVSPQTRNLKIWNRRQNDQQKKTKLTIASKTRAGNETFQKVLWPFPDTRNTRMPIQGSLTEGEGLSTVDLLVPINYISCFYIENIIYLFAKQAS